MRVGLGKKKRRMGSVGYPSRGGEEVGGREYKYLYIYGWGRKGREWRMRKDKGKKDTGGKARSGMGVYL